MSYRYHSCGYPVLVVADKAQPAAPAAAQDMANQQPPLTHCPWCRRAYTEAELAALPPDPGSIIDQWAVLWPGVRQQLETRIAADGERQPAVDLAVPRAMQDFDSSLQRLAGAVSQLHHLPVLAAAAGPDAAPMAAAPVREATQRTVLVPLDGSPDAEAALLHAVRVAQASGWAITLVRVVQNPTIYAGQAGPYTLEIDPLPFWEEEVRVARSYLDRTAAALRERGLTVLEQVLDGDPATALLAWVGENPSIAMVVMSTHGYSGFRRLVLGSVAEKVLHTTPVPLLLVRSQRTSPHADVAYQTLLVPLDGSASAEQALPIARQLAGSTGATVALLHVMPTPNDVILARQGYGGEWDAERLAAQQAKAEAYLQAAASAAFPTDIPVKTLVRDGHAGDQIVLAAEEIGADLVVMATHGQTGLRRFWLGSMATYTVRHSAIPVLLVREPQP